MQFPRNPTEILYIFVALILAVTFHEFSHAWAADRLGDRTARYSGRLSLNPVVHFDPLGFFMMILLALGFFAIAWGRPVPVNPFNLRGQRRGMALVSVAGPLSNLVMATVFALPLRYASGAGFVVQGRLAEFLLTLVYFNVLLMVFNLIPLPPLDGFHFLQGVLPRSSAGAVHKLEQYGPGLLLMVIMADWFLHTGILARTISPAMNGVVRLLLG